MSASLKSRLGVVGLGGATSQILPSIVTHPNFMISAGADPRPEARAQFANTFGASVFETVEELCTKGSVDVVYIAAPSHLHMEIAVLAANQGKHVIVEKPMAISLRECDLMIDAARANRIHLMVGHTHAFNAPVLKAREIISSGELGRLSMITSMNFNDYLYRPRWSHELQTEMGGGIIYNQVPHQVDVVRMLAGGLVSSVRSAMWAHDGERRTEGSHLTFLQFEDGSAASMTISAYDFFDTDEFNFWVGELGEKKDVDRHGSARRLLSGLDGAQAESQLKLSRSFGGAGHAGVQGLSRGQPTHHAHFGFLLASCTLGDVRPSNDGVLIYSSEGCRHVPVSAPRAFPEKSGVFDEMHEAIAGIRPLRHDGQWGRATQEVCEAIRISAREKREVFLSRQVPFDIRSA